MLYREYTRRIHENRVGELGARLDALLKTHDAETLPAMASRCTDVLSTLSEQHTEEQTIKRLTHDIYAKWQAIKAERTATNERRTRAKLVARKLGVNTRNEDAAGLGMVASHHVDMASDLFEEVLSADPEYALATRGKVLLQRLRRARVESQARYALRLTHEGASVCACFGPAEPRAHHYCRRVCAARHVHGCACAGRIAASPPRDVDACVRPAVGERRDGGRVARCSRHVAPVQGPPQVPYAVASCATPQVHRGACVCARARARGL